MKKEVYQLPKNMKGIIIEFESAKYSYGKKTSLNQRKKVELRGFLIKIIK